MVASCDYCGVVRQLCGCHHHNSGLLQPEKCDSYDCLKSKRLDSIILAADDLKNGTGIAQTNVMVFISFS